MSNAEKLRAERETIHQQIEALRVKVKALSEEIRNAEYLDEDTRTALKRAAKRGIVMPAEPAKMAMKGRKKA